jgi:NAD(P)-dependent dehydrogenase (short-subunit alcohol dehydrogenase family)
MSEKITASELLRPGLLDGVRVLVAGADEGPPEGSMGAAVRAACAELGARVAVCQAVWSEASQPEEQAAEAAVEGALAGSTGAELLVVDAAALLAGASEGEGARTGLRVCLEGTWSITRAAAQLAFLGEGGGGRIVFLAPAPGAGGHAAAACAGLENLARTLSVEWARHSITVVAIVPGAASTAEEVAALCAYLASPAGAYFSGCLLDLRGVAGAGR